MKRLLTYLLLTALLFSAGAVIGQTDPAKAGRIENGKFVLSVDPNWDEEQREKFATLFDIDSVVMAAIAGQNFSYLRDSARWDINAIASGFIELSRRLADLQSSAEWSSEVLLSDMLPLGSPAPPPFSDIPYGVNDFKETVMFRYGEGENRFFLPGYETAKTVFLSGSFNDWSTRQLPMAKTDSGWIANVSLMPGKHLYKYIVDGRWISDPNNRLKEGDGHRGHNSVVFVYNYVFRLNGYDKARRVILSGSFNDWDTRKLRMEKTAWGWILPIYLREGTHTYKFIVDGEWITDPDNPDVRPDGAGNMNSFIGIGEAKMFRLNGYTGASKVILSGEFNGWNTGELLMEKTEEGWELSYVMAAGNYQYKFIVDGNWITDPDNPFTSGSGEFLNSVTTFKPNHLFFLKGFADAKEVMVTGSFNGWLHDGYRMVINEGEWVIPLHLKPGKHTYKFIVDGDWILDPANDLWEENEFGTDNSVLWIEAEGL